MIRTKKGMGLRFILEVILGLALLMIIISIFYVGDSAQGKKILKIIPNPLEYLGMNKVSTPTEEQAIAKATEKEEAQYLFKKIKALAETQEDECFLYLDRKKIEHIQDEEYKIKLTSENKEMIIIIYKEDKKQGGIAESNLVSTTIKNKKPCFLIPEETINYDSKEPEKFYEEYLQKSIKTAQVTLKGEKMYLDALLNYEYEWETDGKDSPYVIYKKGENICFTPTEGDKDLSGKFDGLINGLIDDDAFDKGDKDSIYEYIEKQKKCLIK